MRKSTNHKVILFCDPDEGRKYVGTRGYSPTYGTYVCTDSTSSMELLTWSSVRYARDMLSTHFWVKTKIRVAEKVAL